MRRLLLLATLLLAAAVSFAQEPAFFIERIDVRGTRFTSASVIKKQTLLDEGQTYTEPQLKAAIDRINRLPFVIDAEFALEKGSERERYVLAIRITETKPLFVNAESRLTKAEGSWPWSDENIVEAGVRGFVGSTLLHASTDFDGVYTAGVTQYNLFGTSAFAALNVRWTDRRIFETLALVPDGTETVQQVLESEPSPEVILGIPIRGNHRLHASWARGSTKIRLDKTDETIVDRLSGSSANVAWIYDSTDDALFPTRGNFARVGLFYFETSSSRESRDASFELSFHGQSLFAEARHYWNFTGEQSVSGGAMYSYSRSPYGSAVERGTNEYSNYGVVAGYSASLWPRRQTIRWGDLRFEAEGRYLSSNFMSAPDGYGLRAGVAFRNPWALLRFTLEYSGTADL